MFYVLMWWLSWLAEMDLEKTQASDKLKELLSGHSERKARRYAKEQFLSQDPKPLI